ncbi:MAG: apolipoprotein N-acyltransferase [Bacteroidales bacterium]
MVFPLFLFTALVPMLIIEDYIFRNRNEFSNFSVFFYTYPGFFLWNLATTWWVWNSTPVAILAWALNAMFMGIVFNVFHMVRKNVYRESQGYFVLVVLWITFEYIHLNWKMTWTWLNLGNGFAVHNTWIQWYEYTGTLGGTMWVLIVNILLFKAYQAWQLKQTGSKRWVANGILALAILLVPIAISNFMYFGYEEKSNPIDVVVTQPNLDPYTEQFNTDALEVVDLNLDLAKPFIDGDPMIIACPESAIQEDIWEGNLEWSPSLNKLKVFASENPEVKIIIGASTYRKYKEGEKPSSAARFHKGGGFYYDRYNTAFYIDSENIQIHHKSKLTPGVEYMPSGGIFRFLENFAIDLGGTVGSLAIDEDPGPFTVNDTLKVGPIICYESVFGGFCADYVRKGADLLIIITNDGWWGNTPGHRQHLTFASMRAIETRRSIGRSANTGISCFVNQRGDIHQATEYWKPDAIEQPLNLNEEITFYTSFGDYIGRISAFLGVVFMLLSIVFGIRKRKTLTG